VSTVQKESTAALFEDLSPSRVAPRRFAGTVDNLPARFLWLGDVVLIFAAFLCAYTWGPTLQKLVMPGGALARWLMAVGVPLSQGTATSVPVFGKMLGVASVAGLACLVSIDLLGGYRPLLGQSRTRVLLSATLGPLSGLGATTVILFGLRILDISRLFLFTFVALQVMSLTAWRMGLRAYKLRRSLAGHYARGVLLVGKACHIRELAAQFSRRVPPHAYHVVGGLPIPNDHDDPADPSGREPLPVQVLGVVGCLGDILIRRPIDDVVVVQPNQESSWLGQVIQECDYFRATLRIVPEAVLAAGLSDLRAERESDAMGLPALVLAPSRGDDQPQFLKRLLDVSLSAVSLVVLAPVFAVIAAAIKITTPQLPVLYRWRVVGHKGREFVGYKFTTMQADADARKSELDHLNEMRGPVFKIKKDPRTTRLGRILRKYSLNELPQLWSVLRGDMSLVGPRPAFPHELSRYEYWHKRKLSVKPGITCLWQVRGRNDITDFDDWVRLDLQYIDNWSLWLDVKILIWTVGAIFRGTGS